MQETINASAPVQEAARSLMMTGEALEVIPVSEAQAARAAKDPAQWTPDDLCAYVTEEITRTGPQLPVAGTRAILAGFWERHGPEKAIRVARAAFEVYHGMWMGAPVSIRRFTQSNDEFFSSRILENLRAG